MVTVTEVVERLVARSAFLTEAMAEGLINVSALARRLRPEVEQRLGKPVKAGAIVMAISRMQPGALAYVDKELRAFFRRLSDLSVRSNLSVYTFANSETLLRRQAALLAHISGQPKGFFTFSQGVAEATLIVDQASAGDLEARFAEERLLDKEEELSALTLMLPVENRSLYGVYYYILKELAWNGINLVELISTSNEFTIIVRNADLEPAFSTLVQLREAVGRS